MSRRSSHENTSSHDAGRQGGASLLVFLKYTQAQLDKAYDQSAWVPRMAELESEDGERSAAVRRRMPPRTAQYGPATADLVDIFAPAEPSLAPILVFLHGGAWLRNTREDVSFPAPTLIERGAIYIAPDFGSLKTVRLAEMVENCRCAVEWVVRNAAGFGGDPDRVFLAGHSAGAHLAACALVADWTARGLGATPIKGALLLSGMYDLHPVLLSSRRLYVKLSAAEEALFSPMRHLHRIACPVTVISADQDSPEFKRQSAVFAAALEGMGRLESCTELFNTNHFQEISQLGHADSTVSEALFSLMGLRSIAEDLPATQQLGRARAIVAPK